MPFSFLRTGDRLGRAVVKIVRDDGANGTGFLIAPDILLTNHHVLPDIAMALGTKVQANYEPEPPHDPAGQPATVRLDPATLFVTNAELDFTFCGVTGLEHLGSISLQRDSLGVMPGDYVNIIQHPAGRYKEIALQDNRVVKVDHVVVQYCCDTEPGSSGSPVFNNDWRLVAVHHASVVTDGQPGRKAAGGDPESWYLNEGIRLSAIALWLESVEANVPKLKAQTARLRQAFTDLDGQVGFFGALGQTCGGRTAAELIIDSYRGGSGGLDIAFWNLQQIRDQFLTQIDNLSWVIAEMNLDVWCLTHIGIDDLRMLAERLDAFFRQDYRLLVPRNENNGPPLGILLRRDGVRSASWLPAELHEPPRLLVEPVLPPGRRAPILLLPFVAGPHSIAPESFEKLIETLRGGSGDDPVDLLIFGNGLRSKDWRLSGDVQPDPRVVVLGNEGGFALFRRPESTLGPIFASPNLERVLGTPETVEIAEDRRWPRALDATGTQRPMAIRLVLGLDPATRPAASWKDRPALASPAAALEPTGKGDPGRLDPDLEWALREILARYGSAPR